MPAQAPTTAPAVARQLGAIGERVRRHRKALRINAATAAEAAGMSRVTLHRIEHGEPSVTMGAYLNAMAALGLEVEVRAPGDAPLHHARAAAHNHLPGRLKLADYPQLKRVAWHIGGTTEITPREALDLYERNWRHIDHAAMDDRERALVEELARTLGKGRLLV